MQARKVASSLLSSRVRRKLMRTIPILGTVFAAMHVVRKVRVKGARRGGIDAALDLTPVVGRVKAIYELFRGDIIQPKHRRRHA